VAIALAGAGELDHGCLYLNITDASGISCQVSGLSFHLDRLLTMCHDL
jgi:hypothetical protein